jgi:transglutaminase-like putative cysteine protease
MKEQSQQQGQAITAVIRSARKNLRVFTYVISALLLNAIMLPDVMAIQDGLEKNRQAEAIALRGTPEQKMNQALLKLQEISARKKAKLTARVGNESGAMDKVLSVLGLSQLQLEDVDRLRTLQEMLQQQHQQALDNFQATRQKLIAKQLAPEILQRHDDMVKKYTTQYTEMITRLQALLHAESVLEQEKAATALHELMKDQKLKKSHQFTDPNNLPWGTPNADDTRKPAETKRQLEQLTGISPIPQGTQLAANVITPEMLGQPGGPIAEDLAETPDIQLTDAIKAKAEVLDYDPVTIYNWVRNNIEFIPSYGSIQGADYTLQTGKGNAFDTASLLIALYRASNIPARYAYGTVQIPADKVMNWVGGVEVPEAAQQLLGQGGIPNIAVVTGGQINHIRMEHVWVEAWVDYMPSRAARHKVGDTWIALDASFKQYKFTEGEDIENNVPFDAEGLIAQIEASATVSEEGWVQGVNQADVEAAINNYQQQIEDYITNQNPDATVGDVLGTQKVIIQAFQQLPAGLPYELIARTYNYSRLPDTLRHKFRYTLGTEFYGMEDSRLITFEQSLPELAGKKLAVSFKPASQADEDLINSYLPEPDPATGEIDPSQIPSSLPGYLINLTAELTQNGTVIHSGAAGTMGRELYETLALWSPSEGWQQAVNHPIAGEYRAIGLSIQGASPEQAQALQTEVEATKAVLESTDEAQIDALTKHEVVGDLLYATIFSYLALNSVQDQIQSKAAGVVSYRLPSYGLFSTSLQTSYWFGMPRDVSFAGLVMDVDHLAIQVAAMGSDTDTAIKFVKATGARASAMEHLVPEQMFGTDQAPAQGISAVKALALASTEGQKIWTIDQNNVEVALSAINLDANIETEIRNAVRAGKVATTHVTHVNFMGGMNAGYLLIDPRTGAGAYKIAGGLNGGVITDALGALSTAVGVIATLLQNFFMYIDDASGQALFDFVGKASNALSVFLTIIDFRNCDFATIVAAAMLAVIFTLIIAFLIFPLMFLLQVVISILTGLVLSYFFDDYKRRFCELA